MKKMVSSKWCRGVAGYARTFGLILLIGGIGVQTFTSCSSDDSGGGSGTTISCQTGNACVEVSAETCLELQGQLVQSCNGTSFNSSSSITNSSSSIAHSSSSLIVLSSSSVMSSSSVSSSSVGSVLGTGCNIDDYATVTIGTQTWMAENYNCNVSGSRCYGDNTGGDSQNMCGTYGRLYDWATAMDLPSSCCGNTCSDQIQTKHRGICPEGWHISTDAEWTTLTNFVENDKSCTNCAAMYLKAQYGWTDCGPSGLGRSYLCEDTYGFAALPSGVGYQDGSFASAGDGGRWWSATENGAKYAWDWRIGFAFAQMFKFYYDKGDALASVRCVKDNQGGI